MPSITLYDPFNQTSPLWSQEITEADYNQLCIDIPYSNRNYGLIKSMLMPVNTYSTRQFAKDFFLPILTYGLEADRRLDHTSSWYAMGLCVMIDTITLPPRAASCIPRVFWNAFRKRNRFVRYLQRSNVPADILRRTFINVDMKGPIQTSEYSYPSPQNPNEVATLTINSYCEWFTATVNLKTSTNSLFDPMVFSGGNRYPVLPTAEQKAAIDIIHAAWDERSASIKNNQDVEVHPSAIIESENMSDTSG